VFLCNVHKIIKLKKLLEIRLFFSYKFLQVLTNLFVFILFSFEAQVQENNLYHACLKNVLFKLELLRIQFALVNSL